MHWGKPRSIVSSSAGSTILEFEGRVRDALNTSIYKGLESKPEVLPGQSTSRYTREKA